MTGVITAGYTLNERFPERDSEFIKNRKKDVALLTEWLEEFRANFIGMKEAFPVIERCEKALSETTALLQKLEVPLAIKSFCISKTNGLPYGLNHHLETMKAALEKGSPAGATASLVEEWVTLRYVHLKPHLDGYKIVLRGQKSD
jgi:hypothetical protein